MVPLGLLEQPHHISVGDPDTRSVYAIDLDNSVARSNAKFFGGTSTGWET